MLTEFQAILDNHLGRINVGKHWIEPLSDITQHIHSVHFHAGPESRELEKFAIEKMLLQSIIEPAQTQWAATIVFAHKKDGT